MLEIMNFYGKTIQLALMRGISWHVVVFSGKRGVYANSLSGPSSHPRSPICSTPPHSFPNLLLFLMSSYLYSLSVLLVLLDTHNIDLHSQHLLPGPHLVHLGPQSVVVLLG